MYAHALIPQSPKWFIHIHTKHTWSVYSRAYTNTYIYTQGITLGIDQMQLIWNTLVLKACTENQRNSGYKWFDDVLSTLWAKEAHISCLDHLFSKLICNLDPSALSETGFSMFKFSMKYINWKHGYYQEANHQMVKSFDLIGMPSLWSIAVNVDSEAVANLACQFLNEMHHLLSPELQHRIAEKREEYIDTCMQHMLKVCITLFLFYSDLSCMYYTLVYMHVVHLYTCIHAAHVQRAYHAFSSCSVPSPKLLECLHIGIHAQCS